MDSPITASGYLRALLCSFIAGIALASVAPPNWIIPLVGLVLSGGFLLLGTRVGKRSQERFSHLASLRALQFVGQSFLLCGLCSLAFALGSYRYLARLPSLDVMPFVGRDVVVEGIVWREPDGSGQTQSLRLGDVVVDGNPVTTHVLARVALYPKWGVGDRLRIVCTLERPEPFEGFRYDRYLAKDNILVICSTFQEPALLSHEQLFWRSWAAEMRGSLKDRIESVIPEPYASLLVGCLLGMKGLPVNVDDIFRKAGLSHLVVASGQNVTLVTEWLLILLIGVGFRRQEASGLLLVGLLGYVLLAGADPSIVRAGIMGGVLIVGRWIGRVGSSVQILLLTLALMLWVSPALLRDDVGFQLSFAATAGLLLLQPKLQGWFQFLPRGFGIREAFATSCTAMLSTLPILLATFGTVSLVAPIVNVLVLPLLPPVLLFGVVAILISFLSVSVARVVAGPAVGGLKLIVDLATLGASVPFAVVNVGAFGWVRAGLVLLSGHVLRVVWRRPSTVSSLEFSWSWGQLALLGVIFLIPLLPALIPFSGTRVEFFSVGQGDATLIIFPNKERWLIDGGPDDTVLSKLGQVLPWYDRRIDVLIPTHADADHITGLIEVARRYTISQVYLSVDDANVRMTTLQSILKDVPKEMVRVGDVLRDGEGEVRVLAPTNEEATASDRNRRSVVLSVATEGKTLLLEGDAPADVERGLLSALGHVDVYKAGHHGSYTSSSFELLNHIRPTVAVISCGADNRYGHPHGIVLKRLTDVGAQLFRTDTMGDIEVRIREGELRVRQGWLWY